MQHYELQPKSLRCLLHRRRLCYGIRNVLVHKESNDSRIGNEFVQQRELLRRQINSEKACSGDVPARPVEARHDAGPDRVPAIDEDDGNGCRRRFGGKRRCIGVSNDYEDPAANQIIRQYRQSIILLLRPAVFDHQIAALDIAGLAQAPVECSDPLRERPRAHSA